MSENPISALSAAVAAELSTELDGTWTLDPDRSYPHGCTLAGPNRAAVFIRDVSKGDDGRLEIHGLYPDRARQIVSPDLEVVRIRVATSRGGLAIAREIVKRIMPTYRDELARAVADLADRAEAAAARAAVAQKLIAAMPAWRIDEDARPEESARLVVSRGRDEITLNYRATHASIRADDLTIDQAVRIAAILAEPEGT